ncbi:identical protein binding [Homalodisca vitripennis]|nr:identical protein binding [Homalodisca vitripennis]KAG8305473.1 identical protein binding [Homalodisca vitripennis]
MIGKCIDCSESKGFANFQQCNFQNKTVTMMSNQEVHFLEDAPPQDFTGTTLQLGEDKSGAGPSSLGHSNGLNIENDAFKHKRDVALVPWSGEDARDFFSHRSELIEKAIKECMSEVVTGEDGDVLGSWLLTEISLWDHEKERLVVLTSKCVLTIKYDFIAMRTLDVRRVPTEQIDTLVIGELEYPVHSLIPRINGLVTGVSGVVKGCLVRPLQDRFTPSPSLTTDINANPLALTNFEPRHQLSVTIMVWTSAQRAFAIEAFIRSNESVIMAQREFRTRFQIPPRDSVPDRNQFYSLLNDQLANMQPPLECPTVVFVESYTWIFISILTRWLLFKSCLNVIGTVVWKRVK